MADTVRTLAALQTLLADNVAGDIGAGDARDFLVSAYQPQGVCDFRLGLEEAVWASTSDQTSKSTIYLNGGTRGNKLGLSDGSSWALFTPGNLALAGLTGLTSARNYDVFAAYSTPTHSSTDTGTDIVTWSANPGWTTGTYVIVGSTGGGLTAGTPYWYNRASATTGSFHTTLANAVSGASKVDLTANITQTLVGIFIDLGPTWNAGAGAGSDTARGTGAGSTALTTLQGTPVNSVSVTGSIGGGTIAASAGLYLGTVRTTDTTTVEDSAGGSTTQVGGKRFVWNVYNQVPRPMAVIDTTDTWVYGTATIRQANAASGNKVEFVIGQNLPVHAQVCAGVQVTNNSYGGAGIGLDRTNGNDAFYSALAFSSDATSTVQIASVAALHKHPGIGYHYLAWVENASSGTNSTFIGDGGIGLTGMDLSGMSAWLMG